MLKQGKNGAGGTFLVAQWLRVCLAVRGGAWVQSPARKLRFPHAVEQMSPGCAPMKKVPHDTLEKTEGKRRSRWQRMRWLDSITDSMDVNLSNSRRQRRTGEPGVLQSMGLHRVGHTTITTMMQ